MFSRRNILIAGSILSAAVILRPAWAQSALRIHVAAPERVNLHWRHMGRANYETLAGLHDEYVHQGVPLSALMNAGIYEVGPDGSYRPQGLHIEHQEVMRPLNTRRAEGANFYMMPNGVFYIDETGAHVVRTADYAPSGFVRLATQSGPLLFDPQGMHPRFIEGSASRKRRNAIGVRGDGQVVFAMADTPINFWDLATELRDHHGCSAALYLDGTISSLWRARWRHAE